MDAIESLADRLLTRAIELGEAVLRGDREDTDRALSRVVSVSVEAARLFVPREEDRDES